MNRKFTVHYQTQDDIVCENFFGSTYKIEDGILEIHGNGSGKIGKRITIIPLRNVYVIEVEAF